MHPLFRKKSRLIALVSLTFLAQCCCCIVPLRWEVERNAPVVQQVLERISTGFLAGR